MGHAQNNINKFLSLFTLLTILFGGFFIPYPLLASGPETLPLIRKTDLEYLGAFRLPREGSGTENGFSFGGNQLAYDQTDNTLFVGTGDNMVGKVSIPTPVISANIDSLPFASLTQSLKDPLEGGLSALPQSSIRGLLAIDGKLYGAASIYHDASNSARVSHFSRSTDLTTPSATPMKALWQADKSGYVGGWLASVPAEWQTLLGGNVVSGNCCMPIVSRTSNGPSAFSWNTSDFDSSTTVKANPLLYYTLEQATLGPWNGSNAVYGGTTVVGGMVIPKGTRSLLYFGANGTGKFCYGTGGASGGECQDPVSASKGQHAYPYNYQVWAYDLNDLVAVKAGTKNPWDVSPYATWIITFPNSYEGINGIGGVAYDAERQIIYLSQARADTDGYSSRALIHAYKVRAATGLVSSPEQHAVIKYNTPNATSTDRGEEATSTNTSQRDPHLADRDAPYGWLRTYRRALGYGRHLLGTLFSFFAP